MPDICEEMVRGGRAGPGERLGRGLALVLSLMGLTTGAALAQTSEYTPLDLDACAVIATYEESGGATLRCLGLRGLSLIVQEGDLRYDVDVGRDDGAWDSPAPFNTLGEVVEWRLDGDVPFAIIVRHHLEDPGGPPRSRLSVKSIAPGGGPGCLIGTVEGAVPEANVRARQIADGLARDFACGAAEPVRLTPEAPDIPAGAGASRAGTEGAVRLAGTGLVAGGKTVAFGADLGAALITVAIALGEPIVETVLNEECGAGPLRSVTFAGGLSLIAQDDVFVGWMSDSRAFTTASGFGLGGTLRAAATLPSAKIFESSLGTELYAAGLGAVFDADERASAVWAGTICAFR